MKKFRFLAFLLLCAAAPVEAGVPAECLQFERHQIATVAQGPYVNTDVSAPAEVRRFRSVILAGSKGAPDFASRFRVVSWGCGSNCYSFALVDRKTGNVYLVPETAALGAAYRLNSGLLVLDPPELIKKSGSSVFATVSLAWDETSNSLRPVPGCDGYAQTGGQPNQAR